MSDPRWFMRVESSLDASFIQPDGTSRPGTDWQVGLKRGDDIRSTLVRAYLDDDLAANLRDDLSYQARAVLNCVSDALDAGWLPGQQEDLSLVIVNPAGAPAEGVKSPAENGAQP